MKKLLEIFFGPYSEERFLCYYGNTCFDFEDFAGLKRWKLKRRFEKEGSWYAAYHILRWQLRDGIGMKEASNAYYKSIVAEIPFFKELFVRKIQEQPLVLQGKLQTDMLEKIVTAILIEYPYAAGPLFKESERIALAKWLCERVPRYMRDNLSAWYFALSDRKQVEFSLAMPEGVF